MKKVNVQILIPTYDLFGEKTAVDTFGIIKGDYLYIPQTDAACPCSEYELSERLNGGDSLDILEEYDLLIVPCMRVELSDQRVEKVGIHGETVYRFIMDDDFRSEYKIGQLPKDICC